MGKVGIALGSDRSNRGSLDIGSSFERFTQGEGGAHDRAGVVGVSHVHASKLLSVFLTSEVVCIGVLAEVGLLTSGADLFEGGASGGGSGRSLVGKDLFGEDFGGERRKRGDSSLEVVTAEELYQIREAVKIWNRLTASRFACEYAAGRWSGRRPGRYCR